MSTNLFIAILTASALSAQPNADQVATALLKSINDISNYEAAYQITKTMILSDYFQEQERPPSSWTTLLWCEEDVSNQAFSVKEKDNTKGYFSFFKVEKDKISYKQVRDKNELTDTAQVLRSARVTESPKSPDLNKSDLSSKHNTIGTFKEKLKRIGAIAPTEMIGGLELYLTITTTSQPAWVEKYNDHLGKTIGKQLKPSSEKPRTINGMDAVPFVCSGSWCPKKGAVVSDLWGNVNNWEPDTKTNYPVDFFEMWLVPAVGYLPARIDHILQSSPGNNVLITRYEVFKYFQVKPGVWFPMEGRVTEPRHSRPPKDLLENGDVNSKQDILIDTSSIKCK